MPDRNTIPPIRPIEQIAIHPIETGQLPNGTPLHCLNMGDQDVSRIDLMIGAGKWEQQKLLVSGFSNLLLKEGAGNLSGKEIAEQLDFYGAWLQQSDGFHYSYITIYTLNKFYRETFEILEKLFFEPHFPEEEFNVLKNRYKQQFLLDNDKVQYLATKTFTEKLFGKEYPYGRTAELDDFDKIQLSDLIDFHQRHYRPDNIRIFLSGKITPELLDHIEKSRFNEKIPATSFAPENTFSDTEPPTIANPEKRVLVNKPDALQNGIRMGLRTANRNHPDFPGLRVLNTILGGYFGSRLMSTIREEKGYTYGISSGINSLKYASYLSIATQTACEHTEALIEEVYNEIDRLQNEIVPAQEMEMVRNYMLGDFARSLDGTFSLIDAYISLFASDMGVEFLHNQIDTVKNIGPEEIKTLARRYLNKEEIIEVVAGK